MNYYYEWLPEAKMRMRAEDDLMPETASSDTLDLLRNQARILFDDLLAAVDRETLDMLNPLLARLVEVSERRS
jgi:hypothetical protein